MFLAFGLLLHNHLGGLVEECDLWVHVREAIVDVPLSEQAELSAGMCGTELLAEACSYQTPTQAGAEMAGNGKGVMAA